MRHPPSTTTAATVQSSHSTSACVLPPSGPSAVASYTVLANYWKKLVELWVAENAGAYHRETEVPCVVHGQMRFPTTSSGALCTHCSHTSPCVRMRFACPSAPNEVVLYWWCTLPNTPACHLQIRCDSAPRTRHCNWPALLPQISIYCAYCNDHAPPHSESSLPITVACRGTDLGLSSSIFILFSCFSLKRSVLFHP